MHSLSKVMHPVAHTPSAGKLGQGDVLSLVHGVSEKTPVTPGYKEPWMPPPESGDHPAGYTSRAWGRGVFVGEVDTRHVYHRPTQEFLRLGVT
ncbi:hypothetical protein VTK73DRAFT_8871 [Phialemonium thermophilum]|uniref:Uncharacterized protein n=1 Tax=Phialemonium thermophilum TaxID=223376 RepID=A0ABR3W633_9PEZI